MSQSLWTSLSTQYPQRSAPSELKRWGSTGFPSISGELAVLPEPNYYNDPNGYYSALGLSPTAKRSQIKAAYRRLAQKYHPDKGGTTEDFKYLSQIYKVLMNPVTRREYDDLPYGQIYLGDCEIQDLRKAGVKDWTPYMAPSTIASNTYSYYAFQRDDTRAGRWYDVLVPIYRFYRRQGQVRLSLENVQEPYVRNYSGYLPVLVLPKYLEPNYFTAFYITHQVGLDRKTLER